MCEIRCSSLLAPAFHCVHRDVKAGGHTHYWLPGGRGSGKSSFVGVEIPLCLMRDAQKGVMSHAVALRRYGSGRRGSPPCPCATAPPDSASSSGAPTTP